MPKSAVFVVPNNQSQEFFVTKSRAGGEPDYVYSVVLGYDTEAKARALCKLREFKKVDYPLEKVEEIPTGIPSKKVKFALASGYRTLINRPEYFDCDYFYYFTKGRWLWTDNAYALYDYIKDGTLTMCDGFLDKLEADTIRLIGDPDTLRKRGNEEATDAYEALQDERAFREWFHYARNEYLDYFQEKKLKYFYLPWIDKNEKGVASIVRSNLLGLLKAKKAEKKQAAVAMRESANVDAYTDQDLLEMSDEEFNRLLFDGQTTEIAGKGFDYDGMIELFHFFMNTVFDVVKNRYMTDPSVRDKPDEIKADLLAAIKDKFSWDAKLDDVYDLFETFHFEYPEVEQLIDNTLMSFVLDEGHGPEGTT